MRAQKGERTSDRGWGGPPRLSCGREAAEQPAAGSSRSTRPRPSSTTPAAASQAPSTPLWVLGGIKQHHLAVVEDEAVRVLHVHHKAKGAQHVPLRLHRLLLQHVVPLQVRGPGEGGGQLGGVACFRGSRAGRRRRQKHGACTGPLPAPLLQ